MRHADLIRRLAADGRMTQRQIATYVNCSPSHVHKAINQDCAEQVYYILFADRIKIGTTRSLATRLYDIPCDELLAVEPGGCDMEQIRHEQFADHRVIGEWFQDCHELRAHIADLRTIHAVPTALPRQRRYAAWGRKVSA